MQTLVLRVPVKIRRMTGSDAISLILIPRMTIQCLTKKIANSLETIPIKHRDLFCMLDDIAFFKKVFSWRQEQPLKGFP